MTGADADAYRAAALPVFRLLDSMGTHAVGRERDMARKAGALLSDFAERLLALGESPAAVRPARYALAVLVDRAARRLPDLDLGTWAAAAHPSLFDGRDMTLDAVRDFRRTAAAEGPSYTGLAAFLDEILAHTEAARQVPVPAASWALPATLSILAFVALVVGYALFVEYRFQTALLEEFDAEERVIGLDRPRHGADLVLRLDRLADATSRAEAAAAAAPLGRVLQVPWVDAAAAARAVYDRAISRQVPPEIAAEIDEALATEGDGLRLYDALRVLAILNRQAAFSADYLAGWLADREREGLARHAMLLAGPPAQPVAADAELVDQARAYAAEANEASRAWLELLRSPGVAALPAWYPVTAIPDLDDVMTRRLGRPVTDPVPGIYTATGWEHARRFGAGLAVQETRAIAQAILGRELPHGHDTPDRVMDRLQAETIDFWRGWLGDLRVRPFTDRDTALLVSGLLARERSPLTSLLSEVWREAGGTDRSRSYAQQLGLATEFGPMIQYVEQGRIREIASLFSALNVALAEVEFDAERGAERLMGVQERSRSVAALQAAPELVGQIVEDVLAQTSAAHSSPLSNPLIRRWQAELYPLCRTAIDGLYPFGDGPDAPFDTVAALLGPGGALESFVLAEAKPWLDTEAEAWRWKPEARLTGLTPEGARFLQRALSAGRALAAGGDVFGAELTFAALAERGVAAVSIGSDAVPVRAAGGSETLVWPGPAPEAGAEISFRDGAATARLAAAGPWGFLRLLDASRLRARDDGARYLVDVRAEAGRVFLEIRFSSPANPVTARGIARGLACPPAL